MTADPPPAETSHDRLDLLKALGDNTRYAIYLEIARSAAPLTTTDVATTLHLHPNTVRPHLERMRDVGLLAVDTAPSGGVGRPQHRYTLAPDAPSLGLEPPLFPLLARLLLQLAADTGADGDDAADAARDQGRVDASSARSTANATSEPCLDLLIERLSTLGFDPQLVLDEDLATIGFAHCPFADLAETNPTIVCGLHRGMVEGFVDSAGGASVSAFRTLADRNGCQVDLVIAGGALSENL